MQRFGFIRPFRLLLCVAALAACGVATAAETSAGTVKIAFIEVRSGAFACTGQSSLNQLREVVVQLNASAKPTDPKKVAFALEGMKHESPVGEVEMRKVDHQMLAPSYLGVWAKQGSPGVKHDADNTGYGFRSEVAWDSYVSAQPTSCQMKRPPA